MNEEQAQGTIEQSQTVGNEADVTNESDARAGGAEVVDQDGACNGMPDIVIPDNWEQDIKDSLTAITDKNLQAAWFKKMKACDDGYQKKFQSVADDRKKLDADIKSFADERALMGQYAAMEKQFRDSEFGDAIYSKFGSAANYFNWLHQQNVRASNNPAEFIIELCQAAGIDSADKLQAMLSSPEATQRRAAAEQRNFESNVQDRIREAIATERERARLEAQVEAFQNDGKHPYFGELRADMAKLARNNPDLSLDELYQFAAMRNPTIAAQIKADEASAQKAADAEAVRKAKNAIGIQTATHAKTTKSQNWQDWLNDQMSNDGSAEDY